MREAVRLLLDDSVPHRLLVMGDLMLDRYVWGVVDRISPEAPIQILRVVREEERLGGAGNVVAILRRLGQQVEVAGVIGADDAADRVRTLLQQIGAGTGGLVSDPGRPTVVKERQIAHNQQVLRVDREVAHAGTAKVQERLHSAVAKLLPDCDAVVISDYAKGTNQPELVADVIRQAREAGVPVLVDPKGDRYDHYRGATLLTPNRKEAAAVWGQPVATLEDAGQAARHLVERFDLEAAAVTLDTDGIVLLDKGETAARHFPIRPREVHDVTGAGDMVAAIFALAGAGRHPWDAAAELANLAAGIVVERMGVVSVTREELVAEASHSGGVHARKIVSADEAQALCRSHRERGDVVVFTNGCFDLLHAGHVEYLHFARRTGSILVVGLNSDRSVRANKGKGRPVASEQERARVLAALEDVDYVVLFDEDDPSRLIQRLRPDVLVKGEDWKEKGVVGREIVEQYGGRVVLAPLVEGQSSTGLIQRIRDDADQESAP